MSILTLATLQSLGACSDQLDEFERRFGASVEVTAELCESVAAVFDFGWAAKHLLSAPAWAEYQRVCDTAWAEYQRVCDTAWAEYGRVCAREFARLYADRRLRQHA